MGEGRRRNDRTVSDPDAVVELVFLLQPPQDRYGVLDGRLTDEHGLEPPLQRGVFLDVLTILVERGRTNTVQLATRECRLDHVRSVHGPVGFARTDQRVHLVDEQDYMSLGSTDFVQNALQPFLELAAIFGAGNEAAHVERHQGAVLDPVRHVTIGDAQRQPFRNRCLANAGLADQHGIVLCPACEDLDCPANFLVAADNGVKFAVARRLRQVSGELLERIIAVLGTGRVRRASAAELVDGGIERLGFHPGIRERSAGARRRG